MARIELTSLIANISGKVNGSVFQRNQGGLILRNQGGKVNSNTIASNSQKVGLADVQGNWQLLSDADRLLWQTYALYLNKKQKHSISRIVNGHQLFIDINSVRYAMKDYTSLFSPYILTSPILTAIPQPINITSIDRNGLALEVNLDRVVNQLVDVIVLYMSRPLSPSQQSANQKLTMIKAYTISGTVHECNAYYYNTYGRTIDVGEWVQTKIAVYNTASQNYSSYSVQRIQVI